MTAASEAVEQAKPLKELSKTSLGLKDLAVNAELAGSGMDEMRAVGMPVSADGFADDPIDHAHQELDGLRTDPFADQVGANDRRSVFFLGADRHRLGDQALIANDRFNDIARAVEMVQQQAQRANSGQRSRFGHEQSEAGRARFARAILEQRHDLRHVDRMLGMVQDLRIDARAAQHDVRVEPDKSGHFAIACE